MEELARKHTIANYYTLIIRNCTLNLFPKRRICTIWKSSLCKSGGQLYLFILATPLICILHIVFAVLAPRYKFLALRCSSKLQQVLVVSRIFRCGHATQMLC